MPTLNTLFSFDGTNGAGSGADLLADAAGNLFGATSAGGAGNLGTVYEVRYIDGSYASSPTVLVSFNGTDGSSPTDFGGLFAGADGSLFGTARYGGSYDFGTVFEITNTGTGYAGTPTTLATFNGGNGYWPAGGLIGDAAGDLFGTTQWGGSGGNGTVFEIPYVDGHYAARIALVNFDGANGSGPIGELLADPAGDLFGTTGEGGPYNATLAGTVFEIPYVDGHYAGAPTTLVIFDGTDGYGPGNLITDAAGDLFGATSSGGANDDGTVFEIAKTADGYASAPTVLATFDGTNGIAPLGGLVADAAGDLFGTTEVGGASNDGTLFEIIKLNGSYTDTPITLASFNGTDGIYPEAGLIANAAGDLFGTTAAGGVNDDGTVFELSDAGFLVATTITLPAGMNNTLIVTDAMLASELLTIRDGANSNNTVSAAGDTAASAGRTLTYDTGTGTDSFTGGFENDVVDVSAAAVGGDVLTGGSGSNTLVLTSAGTFSLGEFNNFTTIDFAAGNNTVSGSATVVNGDTLTGGSGPNTLVLTSAGTFSLGGVSNFGTIHLAAGNNAVTVTDTTLSGGSVTINDGADSNNTVSADTFTSYGKFLIYDTGTGTDNFTGGWENDTVYVSAAALAGDTFTGGRETNTLILTSAGTFNLGEVSNFGTIDLASGNNTVTVTDKTLSGGSVTIVAGASGGNSISAAGDTAASSGKALTYYAGTGTDSFKGGFESDTVNVSAAALAGDTVTGGSGTNTLILTSAGTINLGKVSNFGTIDLASGNNTVTVTDATLSGGAVTLYAGTSSNNTVSAAGDTAASKGKALTYNAGTGTDSFTGGFENDTVNVSAAAVGGDTLTGGSGSNSVMLINSGSVDLGGVSKFPLINLGSGNYTVTVTDTTLSGGAVTIRAGRLGASGDDSVSAAGDTAASKGKTLIYSTETGKASFAGGFETDVVRVSAATVGSDVLTGGSADNTLILTSFGTFSLGSVSNFGVIDLASGTASNPAINIVTVTDATLSGGAVTMHAGANSDNYISAAGDTAASKGKTLIYYAGTTQDIFTGGFENDVVHISATLLRDYVFNTPKGGGGNNTLMLTSAGSIDLSAVANFGAIDLAFGDNTVTVTDTTLSGGAMTMHAGLAGINVVSAADDTAASKGKTFFYYTGPDADSFTGGFENDVVHVSAATVGNDPLKGGSGNNTLMLTSAGSIDLATVSKFSAIDLAAGNNTVTVTNTTLTGGAITMHAGASGNDSVSAAGDTGVSQGKTFFYYTGTGTDTFTGGSENDVVHVSAAALSGDTLTGGSGLNTLMLTSAGSVDLGSVSKFAAIDLAAGNNTVTVTDTTLATDFAAGINAVVIQAGASGSNSVSAAGDTDASVGETLIYHAGTGTDSFTGGSEYDTIYAGTGLGTYSGGSYTHFVFMADNLPTQTLNNFRGDFDTVVVYGIHASNGFDLGRDNSFDPGGGTAIDPSLFIANASGDFTSSGQRFAYDTTNGQLHYSATGSNVSESLVATLTGAPAMAASDLLFAH